MPADTNIPTPPDGAQPLPQGTEFTTTRESWARPGGKRSAPPALVIPKSASTVEVLVAASSRLHRLGQILRMLGAEADPQTLGDEAHELGEIVAPFIEEIQTLVDDAVDRLHRAGVPA